MYKVLIADDEQLEIEGFSTVLKKSNLEELTIFKATNGIEALSKIEEFRIDIAILDIRMPGMTGMEVAEQITIIAPYCKVIFLTAYSEFNLAKKAIKFNACEYMVKPIDDRELVSTMKKIIEDLDRDRERKKKNLEFEAKAKLVKNYFEKELVSTLFFLEEERNVILEYFDVFDLEDEVGFVFVCDIDDIVTNNLKKNRDVKKRSENIISEVLKYRYKKTFYNFIDNKLCAIVFYSGNDYSYVRNTFHEIVDNFKIGFGLTPIIGVSEIFNSYEDIHQSFVNATSALSDGSENKNIIFYSEHKKTREIIYVLSGYENTLINIILDKDNNAVNSIVKNIIKKVSDVSMDMSYISEQIGQLLINVTHSIDEKVGLDIRISTIKNDVKQLISINQLKTYVSNYLYEMIEKLLNVKSNHEKELIINKICNYIEKYYNTQISLEEVSQISGFSSFYFSKIFKKYKHISFVQYVTKVRIEKSKNLLRETTLPINEISLAVGYSNSNYYTNVFKKIERISPKKYRANCREIKI